MGSSNDYRLSGHALLLGVPACREVRVQLVNPAELLLLLPVVPCCLYFANSDVFASLKIKNIGVCVLFPVSTCSSFLGANDELWLLRFKANERKNITKVPRWKQRIKLANFSDPTSYFYIWEERLARFLENFTIRCSNCILLSCVTLFHHPHSLKDFNLQR